MTLSDAASISTDPLAVQNFRQKLRRDMLARRLALSLEEHRALSAMICAQLEACFDHLNSPIIGFCWPVQNEPDIRPFVEKLLHRGVRAALPVVQKPAAPLVFREWRVGQALQQDYYGIPTALQGEQLIPQTLLIPVNAFDAQGFRLGYGGGFFDRTLATLQPRPWVIGVGFDFQEVASIIPQAHDEPLNAMVTETRIIPPSFSRRRE